MLGIYFIVGILIHVLNAYTLLVFFIFGQKFRLLNKYQVLFVLLKKVYQARINTVKEVRNLFYCQYINAFLHAYTLLVFFLFPRKFILYTKCQVLLGVLNKVYLARINSVKEVRIFFNCQYINAFLNAYTHLVCVIFCTKIQTVYKIFTFVVIMLTDLGMYNNVGQLGNYIVINSYLTTPFVSDEAQNNQCRGAGAEAAVSGEISERQEG